MKDLALSFLKSIGWKQDRLEPLIPVETGGKYWKGRHFIVIKLQSGRLLYNTEMYKFAVAVEG